MHRSWEELAADPVPFAVLSPEGRFLRVNRAACEFFGYSEAELLTLTARDLTHPEDRAQSVALVDRALRHREEVHQVIKRYRHRQGRVLWALLSTTLERNAENRPQAWISRIEDLTARVEQDEVLRAFARRLQTIKEQERQGIARELHEELGQTFAGLKLELDGLHRHLPDTLRREAERLSSVVDDIVGSVRRFTATLRPPILDDLGLESALQWLLVQFEKQTGVAWSFPRSGRPLALDWETRIALFRIAQEGLQHLTRCQTVGPIAVELRQELDWVLLTIADQRPSGSPPQTPTEGLELTVMQERTEVLGGRFQVQVSPHGGVILEARLRAPLEGASGRELSHDWA